MIWDVLVVGAGPVGLATAVHTARRGLATLVLERREAPPDKPCGEGLLPAGVRALERLGVVVDHGLGAAFHGIRYVDGPVRAQARFRHGPGLGVRRPALGRALLRCARDAGASVRFGRPVRGCRPEWTGVIEVRVGHEGVRARHVVAADGLRSTLRRGAGLDRPRRGPPRWGVRRHYARSPWTDHVEVHWAAQAEAYVTPVGPGETGVAILVHGTPLPSFEALLARFPPLVSRLAGATPTTPVAGAGPFHQRVRRRHAGSLALVGDAAGYVDAITGEGLALGFRCAEALADVLATGAPLAAYERAWRRLAFAPHLLTRALLLASRRPRMRRRLVGALAADAGLFGDLLDCLAGDGEGRQRLPGPAVLARLGRRLAAGG